MKLIQNNDQQIKILFERFSILCLSADKTKILTKQFNNAFRLIYSFRALKYVTNTS
jgi:hypothetical protein